MSGEHKGLVVRNSAWTFARFWRLNLARSINSWSGLRIWVVLGLVLITGLAAVGISAGSLDEARQLDRIAAGAAFALAVWFIVRVVFVTPAQLWAEAHDELSTKRSWDIEITSTSVRGMSPGFVTGEIDEVNWAVVVPIQVTNQGDRPVSLDYQIVIHVRDGKERGWGVMDEVVPTLVELEVAVPT